MGGTSLNSFKGKKIYIAFKYSGDGKDNTTTVQIQNIQMGHISK